jgi:hypothetical protein
MATEQRVTAFQVYENILRELNKVNAPSLHLEDYNYFINRGITEYVNRRYNLYDTSQQTTDDLQVLTDHANIDAISGKISSTIGKSSLDEVDGVIRLAFQTPGEIDLPVLVLLPEVNPVYHLTTYSGDVVNFTNLPDFTQLTLIFDVTTGGSITFHHTPRSQAAVGRMVLMGNADSVFTAPAANTSAVAYGKSFNIVNGVLVEIPFSGDPELLGNTPVTNIVNTFPSTSFSLPENYYHMLNCIVNFETLVTYQCYPVGTTQSFTARRMSADMYAAILNNAFMKPEYKRPYFYIKNQQGKVTPRAEIRAGNYTTIFKLKSIDIDYLKAPEIINLTTTQRDNLTDISQVMEFPNYVTNEIVKITTSLIMENASDPRLQTHIPVNMSVPQQPPGMAPQK